MDKSKCVIVNVSTGKYIPEQARLVEWAELHGGGYAVLAYQSEAQVGAPTHAEAPYMFKLFAIETAYRLGFRFILWLDASMLVISDLTPVFEEVERDGYFFQDSGWGNARWTNDRAREYFGTDEGVMFSAGMLGLDMENQVAKEFFEQLFQAGRDGIFVGDWENFRHEQSCGSLIAHKLGMKLQPPNTWFVYGKYGQAPVVANTVCLADGIV